MKKALNYIFLFIVLCIFPLNIYASEIVIITGEEVRFRTEPNTGSNSKTISFLYSGNELTLIDKSAGTDNGCKKSWYKVSNGINEGYICSEWAEIKVIKDEVIINPEDYKEYSEYLKNLGFPDTYITKLIELHNKYPNWQFKIMNIDEEFEKILGMEYKSNGLSLIEDTGNYFDGYKSFDNWSYNYLTNVFNTDFDGGGKNWYAAGKQTIAYYLDPRNFLNEKQIFMFESLSYNKNYHTKEGIELMLKGTFMDKKISDTESNKTYADAFLDAAIKYNISPYVLVSRVIQEIGAKGSVIVSGTVTGYEGYYNFYNIDAHGNSASETIANGLEYAKKEGWNTPYKAILGGATFLVKGYISAGQDTLYLQKWDLIIPYTTHQYMQNIQAPSTESVKTYSGYKNMNLLESAFVFTIPVFKKMPVETKLPNIGNPNNYLSSLSVNGNYLFEKAITETEFKLNLDINTNSIQIDATKVYSGSTINGTGSISLKGEYQTIPITVTAKNGDIRIYNINITRSREIALSISEILNVSEIKNDGTYIYGFDINTDISLIKKNIINKEPKAEVTTTDNKGNSKLNGIIASGDKIKIKTASEEKEYTIVLYGDVNGDGKIAASDYVLIKNHIMDIKKLNNFELICADANKDNKVAASDYVTIKNHIMDIKKIIQ